jgi:ABC-type nitrate/sulfonate/bicarbonate transport system substrate-binding protein
MIEVRRFQVSHFLVSIGIACLLLQGATAQEYFEKYDLAPNTRSIDMAVQPKAYPLAYISSTMQRDRQLRAELKTLDLELRVHPFRKGNDIVKLMGGSRVEMAFLGDMPTVNTMALTPTYVAGLGKRNFSSIVSSEYGRIEALKGKRVAYSAGSSSHLVLLSGLSAAKMKESDVVLVPMEPSQMPDALENGSIDAYSAWEPTPTISLNRSPKNRAIYRGMSTDWVVLSKEFADKHPQAAVALVASFARGVQWMRASQANVERAAAWVVADGVAFTGKPSALPLSKVVEIVRKDLLDVPGAQAVPSKVDGVLPLSRELEFLQQQGRIAREFDAAKVVEAFAYPALKQVQADPKKYRLHVYDYDL